MSIEDFDWVEARSKCSLFAIFQKLKLQLRSDVERIQSLRPPDCHYGFRFTEHGPSATVLVEGNKIHESVTFLLVNGAIETRDSNDNKNLTATPTLSDDRECRLMVSGKERELWQFRKMALESLFFGDY